MIPMIFFHPHLDPSPSSMEAFIFPPLAGGKEEEG